MELKIKNESTNPLPKYQTSGAAGFDLQANLGKAIALEPSETGIIPTGLFVDIPYGYELQIRPRSGLAAKQGITVLNSPGTIDSDYKGELLVILINHSKYRRVINHGDRVAQGVIAVLERVNIVEVDTIVNDTERGTNGLGSTGA